MNPIIVIGPPRSGTSTIARRLENGFGISMGIGSVKPDRHNPKGYFECPELIKINSIAIDSWIYGKSQADKINPQWAAQFIKYIFYRSKKNMRWGFKDPRIIGFVKWVIEILNQCKFKPTWIYPFRDDKKVLRSQIKNNFVRKDLAEDGLRAYRYLIDKNLNGNYFKINMNKFRSDSYIDSQLKGIFKCQ